nr:hypothetical protein [Tanacetum cinerariifolium]
MATTIELQVALDEALVPSTKRLRIGRSNFRLPSDIQSKESTLQVVYDVLCRCPFFKAFLVTADVPEIYMQEFWATAYVISSSNLVGAISQKKHRLCISDLEDFVYQVEHKNQKKSNEMYYPRFTKVIIHHFMTKKPSIPRRNKVNWHYVRDDILFSTIKVVSRHQNTQQYSAILPIELTNDEIRNTKAYKEYYACTTREAAPKPKASARRKRSDDEDVDAQDKDRNDDEGNKEDENDDGKEDDDADKDGAERDNDDDDDGDEEEIAKINEPEDTESGGGDDEETKSDGESKEEETREEEEESFDSIPRTPEDSEDDGNDIEDSHVTLTPVNPDGQQESSSVSSQFVSYMLNPTSDAGMESIFATASSPMAPLQTSTPIMTPPTIATITTISHAPIPPTTIPSEVLQNLLTFDSVFRFEDRLKSLEVNFSKFIQTNHFAKAVSNILGIVHQFMNQQMTEAVQEARIIKEQVKSQVKEQVSRILPRIKESVNAQLKAEVLTRSSHSSRTSYAVVADLSEIELKKILIEKMEGNKSIQQSDKQRNLYKALIDAYEVDKTILDSYGETAILKRRREDDDDQEGPSAGSDRGSKRRREGGEPESARALLEPATRSAGRSTTGSKSRQVSASESAFAEEPVQTTSQIEEPSHLVFETGAEDQPIVQTSQHHEWFPQPKKPSTPDRDWNKTLPAAQGSTQLWISNMEKQADSRSSFNKLLDTPLDFSNFIMNRLGVDTLTLELLAGPTYELMRGSCNSLTELEYHLEEVYKVTTDQLDWVNPEGQQYPHNLLQPLPLIPDNRGRRIILFAHFINNDLEYLRGGASSRKYTTSMTKTKAADYGHIKWIEDLKTISKGYASKNIEDMLLLLVQGKLSNLTVEERFAFNVSLRMFTRSIVIQRRVEDLQLGVESY